MKLAALFSGGKDSTYAIFAARKLGHTVDCLVTINPESDQSHLLHYPDIKHTALQARSMQIPQLVRDAASIECENEVSLLRDILIIAKKNYGIEGIVHGGILSKFQKNNFEKSCTDLCLEIIAPLWNIDQMQYMHKLLDAGFDFILTSVTADGLDDSWLGKIITRSDLSTLQRLAQKHSFNISFEGGEAETFVVNCPLFSQRIIIKNAKKLWDGYRGRFEIQEAELIEHAR